MSEMSRRFTFVTLILTAAVAFLVGTIFAGGITRSAVVAGPDVKSAGKKLVRRPEAGLPAGRAIDFADIVDRINPAVVSIDASSLARDRRRRNRTDRRNRCGGTDRAEWTNGHDRNSRCDWADWAERT